MGLVWVMGHCAVTHDPYQQNLFLCNHMNKNQRRKKLEWIHLNGFKVNQKQCFWLIKITGKSQTGQLDIKLKSKPVF